MTSFIPELLSREGHWAPILTDIAAEGDFGVQYLPYNFSKAGSFADVLGSKTGKGTQSRLDDDEYQVDTKASYNSRLRSMMSKIQHTKIQRHSRQHGERRNNWRDRRQAKDRRGHPGHQPRRSKRTQYRRRDIPKREATYQPVQILAEWSVLERLDVRTIFKTNTATQLKKMQKEIKSETLHVRGKVNEIRNTPTEKQKFKNTTAPSQAYSPNVAPFNASNDPILSKMAENDEGDIFTTSNSLASIMSIPHTSFGFEHNFSYKNGKLFIDSADDNHLVYVCETSVKVNFNEDDDESLTPEALGKEGRVVHDAYVNTVLDSNNNAQKPSFDETMPEIEVSEDEKLNRILPANKAHVYRRFVLPDGTRVVVRGELDGYRTVSRTVRADKRDSDSNQVAKITKEKVYTVVHGAMNPRFAINVKGWEGHEAFTAATATMLSSLSATNKNIFLRWVLSGILSGAEHIDVGFVGRVNPTVTKNGHHHLVSVHKPLTTVIGTPGLEAYWASFSNIVSLVRKAHNIGGVDKISLLKGSSPMISLLKYDDVHSEK